MGIFSKIKKQFKKDLKRTTKVLDPVGHQLRKSTGGSYMDPMNWYNSKPNTAPPYQPAQSPGLMAPPGGGGMPTGPIKLGNSTGGYNYVPNRFAGGVGPQSQTPGLTNMGGGPKMGSPMPTGGMSFGGQSPAAGPQMGQQPQQPPQPQQIPALQNQMLQARIMRGGRPL